MADAKGSTATVRLGGTSTDGRDAELSASGTVITFKGFLHAYEEGRDEERHAEAEAERRLPDLAAGAAARRPRPRGRRPRDVPAAPLHRGAAW